MKKLFLLLLAMPLIFMACEPADKPIANPDDPTEQPDPDPKPDPKPDPTPDPTPKEAVEMVYLDGTYYEPGYWDSTLTSHNFYIMLSTATQVDEYEANASYLTLDIWAAEGNAENPIIPAGEYLFDIDDTGAAGTVGCSYSELIITDATGTPGLEIYPVDGKVIVSANKIEVNFTDAFGGEYAYVYNGTPSLPVVELGSVEIDGTGFYAEVTNYGDYYGLGADNYFFTIVEDVETFSGAYITLDLLVALNASYVGEYTPLINENDTINKFIAGNISGGTLDSSWYAVVQNGSLTDVYQPLYDGTITITDNADGTTTILLDCEDDKGNAITGSITTKLNVVEPSAAALSANKSRAVVAKSKVIR